MENEWKSKHVAVLGVGSVGSAVADMLARAGVRRLTLVDPDVLSEDNLKRHVLDDKDLGKSKVHALAAKYSPVYTNRQASLFVETHPIQKKFDAELFKPMVFHSDPGGRYERSMKPDVIAACVDSLACESQINAYSLGKNVPVVYGGVHGDAHTAEIITVIPGLTPCYECYERTGELPPPGQEHYTDPNHDPTKMPHQEGLWVDVLMAASLQVQAILGVLGYREKFPPLVLKSLRYPFKLESFS